MHASKSRVLFVSNDEDDGVSCRQGVMISTVNMQQQFVQCTRAAKYYQNVFFQYLMHFRDLIRYLFDCGMHIHENDSSKCMFLSAHVKMKLCKNFLFHVHLKDIFF